MPRGGRGSYQNYSGSPGVGRSSPSDGGRASVRGGGGGGSGSGGRGSASIDSGGWNQASAVGTSIADQGGSGNGWSQPAADAQDGGWGDRQTSSSGRGGGTGSRSGNEGGSGNRKDSGWGARTDSGGAAEASGQSQKHQEQGARKSSLTADAKGWTGQDFTSEADSPADIAQRQGDSAAAAPAATTGNTSTSENSLSPPKQQQLLQQQQRLQQQQQQQQEVTPISSAISGSPAATIQAEMQYDAVSAVAMAAATGVPVASVLSMSDPAGVGVGVGVGAGAIDAHGGAVPMYVPQLAAPGAVGGAAGLGYVEAVGADADVLSAPLSQASLEQQAILLQAQQQQLVAQASE